MATGFNTQTGNGEYHLQFETDNRDYYLLMQENARRCVDGKTPMTNADRIRAMSDEELADFLACTWANSARAWQKDPGETLYWLQQPAEEDDHAICGATNLPCIRCNPGGCDNRKEGANNDA